MGPHIFHFHMLDQIYNLDQLNTHMAGRNHKDCPYDFPGIHKMLCGYWRYIEHFDHIVQRGKDPDIPCLYMLVWQDIHCHFYNQLKYRTCKYKTMQTITTE